MSTLAFSQTSLDVAWACAMGLGQVGNGPLVADRAQGYTATNATTGKSVRATTYTPQGANGQRSINSTSASDTAAGIGAQQVTINYLTAAMVLKSETVILNGVTGVNTVNTDIAFIESIVVSQVGSNGANVGAIQVWTGLGAAGAVWGSIAALDNQTFWAHHYVPAGVTCYVLTFLASATSVVGSTVLNHLGNPLTPSVPQQQLGMLIIHPAGGSFEHAYKIPLVVPGPDFLWAIERPIAATASTAAAGFEYIQF